MYTSEGEGGLIILTVHVDDLIIAAQTERRMQEIKKLFADNFTVTDLGELKYVPAVNVDQQTDPGGIWIGQTSYTMKVLEKFGMNASKPVSTPCGPSVKLTKAKDDNVIIDKERYQSAVGSLLYLSTWTRPDITYAVSNVAKFCSKPTKEHWIAVKRILSYLKGTTELCLWYVRGQASDSLGFSDAGWAGDRTDRRSTSGYVFQIGEAAISWRSKQQSYVALCTAEAEYIALASASQEAIWLQRLLNDMHCEKNNPMVIKEDNQSAISITKNPQFHGHAKHIDIKYHYVRELVDKGPFNSGILSE